MGVRLQRLLSHDEAALDRGQYAHVLRHQTGTMATVTFCCPSCSSKTTINASHVIDSSGRVTPAVACSNGACGFLECLELDGWGEAV